MPVLFANLLSLIWLFTFAPSTFSGSFVSGRFDSLASRSGMSLAEIGPPTVAQDKLGFIWVGGEYGLARYDGHDFKLYHESISDPSYPCTHTVRDLITDENGKLWVSTQNILCTYDLNLDRFDIVAANQYPRSAGGNRNFFTNKLAIDGQGKLYIAHKAGLSVLDIKTRNLRNIRLPLPGKEDGVDPNIEQLFFDSANNLWLGSESQGLLLYNPENNLLQQFVHDEHNQYSISNNAIFAIGEDAQGRLWVSTASGKLNIFDKKSGRFSAIEHDPNDPYSIGPELVRDIYLDSSNKLWFASDPGGLARYESESGRFIKYKTEAYDKRSLSSNRTKSIFEDNNHNLWISLFPYGIDFLNRPSLSINNYHDDSFQAGLNNSAISSLMQDNENTIWIGSEKGLNAYDPKTRTFSDHSFALHENASMEGEQNIVELGHVPVVSMEQDSANTIWLGTWGRGLYRYNSKTRKFKKNIRDAKGDKILSDDAIIWDIMQTRDNKMWVTTERNGAYFYDPVSKNYRAYPYDKEKTRSLSGRTAWAALEDVEGRVWIGTERGLDRVDPENGYVTHLSGQEDEHKKIGVSIIRCLAQDDKGNIWIGTANRGIYVFLIKQQTFVKVDTNAIPSAFIVSLQYDKNGNMWAATSRGLVKINTITRQVVNISNQFGFANSGYDRNASVLAHNGDLLFASSNGLSLFNPNDLSPAVQENFPVEVVSLLLFFDPVKPGNKSPIKKPVHLVNDVVFNHEQNVFSFQFSALSYILPQKNEFSYMLEGFDNDWNNSSTYNLATYTNLDPGQYTFKLKAKNSYNQWSNQVKVINIEILPAPWRTWWAYLAYAILFFSLVAGIIYAISSRRHLAKELLINEKLVHLDKIKDSFLASTSHELRTPLNGIIGITETLRFNQLKNAAPDVKQNLSTILATGKRLSLLINDILDYSKLADNNLELYCQPTSLYETCDATLSLLDVLLRGKPLTIANKIDPALPQVWADPDRLQQIMINIIGNGIKYSDKGEVVISANQVGNVILITVADTGIGIPPDKIDSIFDAFSQVDSGSERRCQGTGLGLAITKRLIELHNGYISVESKPDKGSRFTFSLNVSTKQEMKASANLVRQTEQTAKSVRAEELVNCDDKQTSPHSSDISDAEYVVLIVDDDPVNRIVLSGILQLNNYKIIEASSGQQALDVLENHTAIDLIILDVMMPRMDGFETCKRIRKQYSIGELPIFFLTAKNVGADIAKGFHSGGNNFLYKPVHKDELLPKVDMFLTHQRNHAIWRRSRFEEN